MPPLMNFQRPRRIAAVLLFVWLFSVAASWANACLVQPVIDPASAHGHHGWVSAGATAADAQRSASGGAAHEPDPAQTLCAEFCGAGQQLVAKPQPTKGDGAVDAQLHPPTALLAWPAFAPTPLELPWRPLAAPLPPGPCAAIVFLRLTL